MSTTALLVIILIIILLGGGLGYAGNWNIGNSLGNPQGIVGLILSILLIFVLLRVLGLV